VKPRLIVIGPLPPPSHGVTVSTSLVLANPLLRDRFDVTHVDTSDHRTGRNVGTWDLANVLVGLRSGLRLLSSLRNGPGLVYLPLSQSAPGFLRDAILISLASVRDWRIAAHLRGSDFPAFYEGSARSLRAIIRRTLHRVDSVAVMGESLRPIFDGLVPAERVAVVPNGTPEPRINGTVRDPNTVLFLSNLRRRKGIVESVETALLVVRERPNTRFVFAGEWEDATLEQELRRKVETDRDRIKFIGPRSYEEKDRLLGSASVLLFPPTESEGHPRVVLEALAAGLPVVATDQGTIGETIVEGQSGFVVPRADPSELASRILRLLDDPDLYARMSSAARARHLDRYTQPHADKVLGEWLARVALQ
jgi:glycosyltransferase involved in cell wall biosynthesis